jgi:hypothetical protein
MISANSENEQATILNLTETELEGIYGGWSHGYDQESDSCGNNDRFGFRGGEGFDFRSSKRFSFYGNNNCW